MKGKLLFHFLFVLVMTCPVMGQVAKKTVTEADYKLWSTMDGLQLSDAGNWASYAVHYESGLDTLFVKQTKTLKTYAYPGGTNGRFVTDQFFMCRGTNGGIILTNLKSGKQQRFSNISSYALAMGGSMLVMLKNAGTSNGDLVIVDTDGKKLLTMPKVTMYSLNPASTMLVCDSGKELQLLDLNFLNSPVLLDAKERNYKAITWQGNGASFAYITADALGTVGYYRVKEKKLYTFDRNQFSHFPKDGEIYNASGTELSVSEDGTRIFFGIKEKESEVATNGVQLWNTADKMLYPWKAQIKDWKARPKLAVWFPEQQQLRMVTDTQFPYHVMVPGQELALLYNPIENEPQFDYEAPIDYYLQNIATGINKLILPKFSADQNKISISRAGKYIAYFSGKNWWLYDIKSNTHRNLTSQTGQSFTEEKYDRSGEVKVSGIAGWTANDKELLVYDTYDVWLLKTDGSSAVRLTKGREEQIVYRVVPTTTYLTGGSHTNEVLNLNDGLLLEATAALKRGYFIWDAKKGLQQLVFEGNRITSIKASATNGVYCYIREHYHLSPQLMVQFTDKKVKVLYQSNPQQKNYQWGFSKLITYENSKGQLLNGALFYPAGYDADKSYPMVVYIYERLSDFYNQYVNPSLLNQEGFNISNLTAKGYFVLLPDIAYQEGETGRSALDCVTAAVDEVLANESVDPKRLGLIGHSFGGYETNFIITQTNRFATAISGSGMSDIISSYLTVGGNNTRSNGWRYEYNQSRMGVSLFDGYQKYLQNSPITFASQVETPLLLWSGEADRQVHYYQSLEFHLALRRLQKPNILLLYEGERHTIMGREHQMDLTHRTQEWFDYYLKAATKPDWFTPDGL